MLEEMLGDLDMRVEATGHRWLSIVICLATFISLSGAPSDASTTTPACSTMNLSLGFGERVSAMTGERAIRFTLTNRGKFACHLFGYSGVSFYDSKGRALLFKYTRSSSQYMTQAPPTSVELRPNSRAYFLVAKNRCDIGDAIEATSVRIYPPNTRKLLIRSLSDPTVVVSFAYCKGGAKDSDQVVDVSPVRATTHSM